MTSSKRKNITFFKVLEIIVDIIVYPVIIISFMSSFFMLVAKSKNVISPIFGHTFVRVLSSSMSVYCPEAERNFNKGDVVLLKVQNSMYEVGDIIAFYSYNDNADTLVKLDLTQIESGNEQVFDENGNPVLDEQGNITYRQNNYMPVKDSFDEELYENVQNAQVGEKILGTNYIKSAVPQNRHDLDYVRDQSSTKVYFHQIVQIKIDTSGTIFYITKGTYNDSTETVREDLVAGKYLPTAKWLTDVVSFCSSTEGMIALVVAPISFIVLIELLSILEQINNIILERKVIAREMPFDGKDCQKARIGIEMRDTDKIFYYDVMPKDYKAEVFEFLWGEFKNSEKQSERDQYDLAWASLKVYNMKDPSRYYQLWKQSFDSLKKKQQVDISQSRSKKEKYIDVACFEYRNERPIPKKPRIKRKKITEINNTIENLKQSEENTKKLKNNIKNKKNDK